MKRKAKAKADGMAAFRAAREAEVAEAKRKGLPIPMPVRPDAALRMLRRAQQRPDLLDEKAKRQAIGPTPDLEAKYGAAARQLAADMKWHDEEMAQLSAEAYEDIKVCTNLVDEAQRMAQVAEAERNTALQALEIVAGKRTTPQQNEETKLLTLGQLALKMGTSTTTARRHYLDWGFAKIKMGEHAQSPARYKKMRKD